MSPLLFNSVLEVAMDEWKRGLLELGIAIVDTPDEPMLTNIRFADDLLLFAESMEQAISMVDSLSQVLGKYGLEMNKESQVVVHLHHGY